MCRRVEKVCCSTLTLFLSGWYLADHRVKTIFSEKIAFVLP